MKQVVVVKINFILIMYEIIDLIFTFKLMLLNIKM